MAGRQINDLPRKERARENYPPLVLLERCPECGAESGDFCRSTPRRRKTRGTPHDERVAATNLGRRGTWR